MELNEFYKQYAQLTPEQRNTVVVGVKNPLTFRELYLMLRENERMAMDAVNRIRTLLDLMGRKIEL